MFTVVELICKWIRIKLNDEATINVIATSLKKNTVTLLCELQCESSICPTRVFVVSLSFLHFRRLFPYIVEIV